MFGMYGTLIAIHSYLSSVVTGKHVLSEGISGRKKVRNYAPFI